MTHSRSKLFAALGSAALVLTFCLVNPATAADRLRIGLSSFTPINAAVWIAEDKGLFKKYGIDPEVIVVGGASATDLDMLLRARGVKSLLVTGVGTGMCVFHTLTVGFMLDYYITLVEDCAATTYGRAAHDEAVALVKKHYGRIASSEQIIAHWTGTLRNFEDRRIG